MDHVEGGGLPIIVTDDPQQPTRVCRPALQLQQLLDAGALPNFLMASSPDANTDGLGNCHEASLALMTDLIMAKAADRWHWVTGIVDLLGEHSWLERDGWALDCAGGKMLFMDRAAYRRSYHARDVVRRDAARTQRWMLKIAAENPK